MYVHCGYIKRGNHNNMIINNKKTDVTSSAGLEGEDVKVDEKNVKKIIHMLSSQIYTYPGSAFREYWLNSREAVAAKYPQSASQGQAECKPTEIYLPYTKEMTEYTERKLQFKQQPHRKNFNNITIEYYDSDTKESNIFKIRDYGVGATHDDLNNIIVSPASSTKQDSNEFGGGLGIGAFSGSYLSNSVIYTAFKDGVKSTTVVNFTNGKKYDFGIQETDEPDGMQVEFAIRDMSQCDIFTEEALEFLLVSPSDESAHVFTKTMPSDNIADYRSSRHGERIVFKPILNKFNTRRRVLIPNNDACLVTVNGCFYYGNINKNRCVEYVKNHLVDKLEDDLLNIFSTSEAKDIIQETSENIVHNMLNNYVWEVPVGRLSQVAANRESFVLTHKEEQDFLRFALDYFDAHYGVAVTLAENYDKYYENTDIYKKIDAALYYLSSAEYKELYQMKNTTQPYEDMVYEFYITMTDKLQQGTPNTCRTVIDNTEYFIQMSDTLIYRHSFMCDNSINITTKEDTDVDADTNTSVGNKPIKKQGLFAIYDSNNNSYNVKINATFSQNKNEIRKTFNMSLLEEDSYKFFYSTSKAKKSSYWSELFVSQDDYTKKINTLSDQEKDALDTIIDWNNNHEKIFVNIPGYEKITDEMNDLLPGLLIADHDADLDGKTLRDAVSKIEKKEKKRKTPQEQKYHTTQLYTSDDNTNSHCDSADKTAQNIVDDSYDNTVFVLHDCTSHDKYAFSRSVLHILADMYDTTSVVSIGKTSGGQKVSTMKKKLKACGVDSSRIIVFTDINKEVFTTKLIQDATSHRESMLLLLTACFASEYNNDTKLADLLTSYSMSSAFSDVSGIHILPEYSSHISTICPQYTFVDNLYTMIRRNVIFAKKQSDIFNIINGSTVARQKHFINDNNKKMSPQDILRQVHNFVVNVSHAYRGAYGSIVTNYIGYIASMKPIREESTMDFAQGFVDDIYAVNDKITSGKFVCNTLLDYTGDK